MGRIGVYPGSFNPPTIAHLAIARRAIEAHGLDRIDLSVSRTALAKETVDHPRFADRISVIEASVSASGDIGVRVTERQLLVDIAEGYDVLVVGADKWRQIHDPDWYGGDPGARDLAMAQLPRLAVVPRDGIDVPTELVLDVDAAIGISSTRARSGALELMTPPAREFAVRTGAWIDRRRYDRTRA